MSLTEAKPILEEEIFEAFTFESSQNESPEESRKRISKKIANAIDKYVKAGLVKTTGTATAQTGNIT